MMLHEMSCMDSTTIFIENCFRVYLTKAWIFWYRYIPHVKISYKRFVISPVDNREISILNNQSPVPGDAQFPTKACYLFRSYSVDHYIYYITNSFFG